MKPSNLDAAARAARERVELAVATSDMVMAMQACDMLSELFAGGYRLLELAPDCVTEVRPVLLTARFAGRCPCGAAIAAGDFIWWQRNVQHVECDACGNAKGFKAA